MTAQQKYNKRMASIHKKPKKASRFFVVAKRQDKGILDFLSVRYDSVDWNYKGGCRKMKKLLPNCV